MAWIQLIFTCTSQQAETLSDVLSATGAASVTFQDYADQPIYEPAIGETPLWSVTSVIALFDAETDCDAVLQALHSQLGEIPEYHIETVEDKDWEREWMDNFHPICFGEKLWIVPSWHQPPQPEAVNILLDPGLAFGTGTHPTTALCLQWLDNADLTGKTVIDYGCGSGILAIAAALLGADKVIGVDTDPQALEATQANAARNNVIIETYLPQHCPEIQADLLLANILAEPLIELMPRFLQLTHRQSELVLSGILEAQAVTVHQHYQTEFTMDEAIVLEEWVRLSGVRHG